MVSGGGGGVPDLSAMMSNPAFSNIMGSLGGHPDMARNVAFLNLKHAFDF